MKKISVISEFLDKYDLETVYKVGEVLSVDDDRAADLVERRLAAYVTEPEKQTDMFAGLTEENSVESPKEPVEAQQTASAEAQSAEDQPESKTPKKARSQKK